MRINATCRIGRSLDLVHGHLSGHTGFYLRYIFVQSELDNIRRIPLLMRRSVPQGSLLGPLLFLLFVKDLTEALEPLTLLFADDV